MWPQRLGLWTDLDNVRMQNSYLDAGRPAIHSDFVWIIQIFSLKFSEIQITWLKIQIFGFEFGRNFLYKSAILVVKFRFFSVYSDFFSHSFRFCVRSKWQACAGHTQSLIIMVLIWTLLTGYPTALGNPRRGMKFCSGIWKSVHEFLYCT